MKTASRWILAAAAALSLLAAWVPASAQDGPIRQRIKERLQQRAQHDGAGSRQEQAANAAPLTRPGDYRFSIQHGGSQRAYLVHVPASYDPAKPAPVLFALHGGGGNMDYQASEAYGLVAKADKEGFIAVFPNGYSRLAGGKFATWNAGNCCGAARDQSVDDVGFIRAVFHQLARQVNVDRSRVYATGMSNGAMMAYRLACEVPDVFRAIAAVAGTDNTRSCAPARPVAVLHIHAKDDSHVLFNGGAGPDAAAPSTVTDFVSVPDTVAKWARLNGCTVPARRVLQTNGAFCELYTSCGGAPVQLCVTETGGHSWPGGHKRRADQPPSQAISANDVMWEFFSRQATR
jgi:polyhydroxybutyrate depolymerase